MHWYYPLGHFIAGCGSIIQIGFDFRVFQPNDAWLQTTFRTPLQGVDTHIQPGGPIGAIYFALARLVVPL